MRSEASGPNFQRARARARLYSDALALTRLLGLSRDSTELAVTPFVPADRLQEVGYEIQDLFEELDDDASR